MRPGLKLITFMLLLTLTVAGLANALAQDGKAQKPQEPMGSLVVILSSDDNAEADASFRIAEVAAKRGHKVTILLRVRALKFAVKDNPHKIGESAAAEVVSGFMKRGCEVFVGGSCMMQQGIPKDSLIKGVQVGTPDTVMGMLFAENARIICQ